MTVLTVTRLASAEVDARALARAVGASGPTRAFRAESGRVPLVVELPPGVDPVARGVIPASPGFGAVWLEPGQVSTWTANNSDLRAWWSPPRRPLLDRADDWTHAALFTNLTGLTGAGVVVGIVDTGFDPQHPDLLDDQGDTRARWVIDFSKPPRGLHPELEAAYGCTSEASPCAISSGADVDQLLASGSSQAPRDPFGHGTHVASLAAGDGSSNDPTRFVGPARDATLIVARVTRSDGGSIYDADILTAARFVFDRAEELGMPAVVNLSLGSDFGAHDGSGSLERGLAAFVGPTRPGRALVVAAGNSAGVYTGLAAGYPEPFGIHTEVHVPRSSSVRVPLLSPPTPGLATRATIYVWIATRPGDELAVGLDDGDGEWIEPLPPGTGASYRKGELEATIINDEHREGSPIPQGSSGAVVVLEGSWRSGSTFALRLEGHGSARVWVQSEGDLGPGTGSVGAVFPRASKQGTIGIPASSPSLIAVGATINRLGWTDREGNTVQVGQFGALEDPPLDSAAYFSGAGPTSDARMKPDIVAPGVFVIGAMSRLADPKTVGDDGIFGGSSVCGDIEGCLVVDDFHAVSTGTSMAAPIVAGAVALLLQRDPSLTQDQIRTLLRAGARRPEGDVSVEQQAGPGALDLVGTLRVLDAMNGSIGGEPDASESWISLASSYVHPDPEWPLHGVVQLRTAAGEIADVDPARVRLQVSPGQVESFVSAAPGMWELAVAAPRGSGLGELTLTLTLDGSVLLERRVAIATDRWVAEHGVDARGGCGIGRAPQSGVLALGALLALAAWRRRRRSGA